MMKVSRIAVLLFAVAVVVSHADETNLTLTVDGVTYSNVTFGTVTPSKVTIFFRTGVARIPLEKLPPELQKTLGYTPERAAEFRAAESRRAEEVAAARKREESSLEIGGSIVQALPNGALVATVFSCGLECWVLEDVVE